jgi:hypothetical protein
MSYQSPIYDPMEFLAVRICVPNEPRYELLFPQQSFGLGVSLKGLLIPALLGRGDFVGRCIFIGTAAKCVGILEVSNVAAVSAHIRELLRPMLLVDSFVEIYSYDAREQIFRPADSATQGGMVMADLDPLIQAQSDGWNPFIKTEPPQA